MNWTNKLTNTFGTITAFLTMLSGFMVSLGCKPGAVDFAATCSISWLPVEYTAYVAMAFGFVTFLLKLFRPGGVVRNLFGSTAVVTPTDKPGTVTAAQVGVK
jgi:hypothetical protein